MSTILVHRQVPALYSVYLGETSEKKNCRVNSGAYVCPVSCMQLWYTIGATASTSIAGRQVDVEMNVTHCLAVQWILITKA